MTASLRFDGRVAVVTGAGQGIGAAHARLLASRGASVVVNDLGTAMDGAGRDIGRADAVVAQIRSAGGTAIADHSNVTRPEETDALVQAALTAFGRIDILVNNAGILTDGVFPELELAEFENQWRVHVAGSFNVTRSAWPHLVQAGYGRVVMTSSPGALGSARVSAYASAKAGVLGFGRSLAALGATAGIKVNIVAPMARTRMNDRVRPELDPTIPIEDGPELVSPLVAFLCHEDCAVTGETFIAGMGRYARLAFVEFPGYLRPGADITPELIAESWADVMGSMDSARIVTDTVTWSRDHHTLIQAMASGPIDGWPPSA